MRPGRCASHAQPAWSLQQFVCNLCEILLEEFPWRTKPLCPAFNDRISTGPEVSCFIRMLQPHTATSCRPTDAGQSDIAASPWHTHACRPYLGGGPTQLTVNPRAQRLEIHIQLALTLGYTTPTSTSLSQPHTRPHTSNGAAERHRAPRHPKQQR